MKKEWLAKKELELKDLEKNQAFLTLNNSNNEEKIEKSPQKRAPKVCLSGH